MSKTVLFAFNGEVMCFVHVLLNALDMTQKGVEAKIVIEGAATKVIPEISKPDNPMNQLYVKAKEAQLFDGACRACSNKLGVADVMEQEGIALIGEMSGHPSMQDYINRGFQIITF